MILRINLRLFQIIKTDKNIYNEFVEKMASFISKIKIGDPEDNSTELGPLAAMRQVD